MNDSTHYRLVIADDHTLFRGALREAVGGLFERTDGTFNARFNEYHAARYSRTLVKATLRCANARAGRSASSRCRIELGDEVGLG